MVEGTYERKVSTKRFLLTFVLVAFVFLIGISVGNFLTSERTSYLEDIAYKQKLDYESLQLQSLYLDINANNASCSVFSNILETSLEDVGAAQAKVDLYIKDSNKESYTEIKRDYLLVQIRYWLLNQKIKLNCKSDQVSVLYFYSNDDCIECGAQGTILTYLKEKLGDRLMVFSLDSDFTEEPVVNIIKKSYNITQVPSIVVEDKTFGKLVNKEDLTKEICSLYKEKPELCNQ